MNIAYINFNKALKIIELLDKVNTNRIDIKEPNELVFKIAEIIQQKEQECIQ